ncbi:MAG: N-acetylmuramoyl-L-alanine amidase [Elusimicrobiota bacterium]
MVKSIGVAALLSSFAVCASATGMDAEDIVFQGKGVGSVLSSGGEQTTGLGGEQGCFYFDSGPSDPVSRPFDAVGINGVLPDIPVGLEVSRENQDGSWSEWIPMEQHPFEGGRFWAKAVLPPAAPGRVRIRAKGTGTPEDRAMSFYGFEAFERRQEAAGKEASVEPEPAATRVITRAEWGAKPAKATEPMSPYRITIHHTEGAYPASIEEGKREVRIIQDYHMNGRGWNDIGYQYLMDGLGNLYQGRPEKVLGAHVSGANSGNIGVSVMGNYMERKPNDAQMDSLKSFLPVLARRYGIPSTKLYAHRELGSSDCPGDNLFAKMPELRKALDGREGGLVARLATAPLSDSLDGYAACFAGDVFDGR